MRVCQPIPTPIIVTPPVNLPITVEALKNFLRVDINDDDQLIELILKSAIEKVEKIISKKLIDQTWDIFFSHFPYSTSSSDWWDGVREGSISELNSAYKYLELPFGNLKSVSSIDTIDDAGDSTLFASSNYRIEVGGVKSRIALVSGASWPSSNIAPVNGIKVRAIFGYGADESFVPSDIKFAIMTLAARMYEHRGDELPEIPAQVMTLLSAYDVIRV